MDVDELGRGERKEEGGQGRAKEPQGAQNQREKAGGLGVRSLPHSPPPNPTPLTCPTRASASQLAWGTRLGREPPSPPM